MIKFGYTILYVHDVRKQMDFYERAFGFAQKFIAPGDEYGELLTGETTLSICAISLAKTNLPDGFIEIDPKAKPFGMEIGFTTSDVQGVVNKAIAEGATLVSEPKTKPWGQTVAYVRDPEGFLIEVCSPMEN
jgi:lactoylglutathione lyase